MPKRHCSSFELQQAKAAGARSRDLQQSNWLQGAVTMPRTMANRKSDSDVMAAAGLPPLLWQQCFGSHDLPSNHLPAEHGLLTVDWAAACCCSLRLPVKVCQGWCVRWQHWQQQQQQQEQA